MSEWHGHCNDLGCNRRCRRPGCLEPEIHFFAKVVRENKRLVAYHSYDCRIPIPTPSVASVARQAIEELRSDMGPGEISIARRVIRDALNQLERATAGEVIDMKPREEKPKRPQLIAAPRPITRARAEHLEWLAQRKESA